MRNMLIRKLKTSGKHNYCSDAFVVYHNLGTSLMSCGVEICVLRKDGTLVMKCNDEELTAADKRHLKIFCKQLEYRMP